MLNRVNKPAIGVDIGVGTLRAVAVHSHGARYRLVGAAETQRAANHPVPTQSDVERLIRAMQRQGIDMRSVTLAAPPDQLSSAIVELPPRASGAPIETLAKAELQKNTSGQLEVYVWDLPQSKYSKVSEYLAVGLSHAFASELIKPFESAGLSVVSIEPASTALQRVTGANSRLVFDVGRRGVRIYAFEGSLTLFVRHYDISNDAIDSDRIRASLTGSIDYLADRFPALEHASVIVVGDPELSERLSSMLHQEYETTVTNSMLIDLQSESWLGDLVQSAHWAVSIGLAVRCPTLEMAA